MFARLSISDQKGFTLIELISVMIIFGMLASVTIKKFDLISDAAAQSALWEGVRELNARETLVWTNSKLSNSGWTSDVDVFAKMDTELGFDYVWTAGPDASGGTLSFRSEFSVLSRRVSTTSSSGRWN